MNQWNNDELYRVVNQLMGAVESVPVYQDPYGKTFLRADGLAVRATKSMSEALFAARSRSVDCASLPTVHDVLEVESTEERRGRLFLIVQQPFLMPHQAAPDVERAFQFIEENGLTIEEYIDIDDLHEDDHELFAMHREAPEHIASIKNAAALLNAIGCQTTEVDIEHVAVCARTHKPLLIHQLDVDLEVQFIRRPELGLGDFGIHVPTVDWVANLDEWVADLDVELVEELALAVGRGHQRSGSEQITSTNTRMVK